MKQEQIRVKIIQEATEKKEQYLLNLTAVRTQISKLDSRKTLRATRKTKIDDDQPAMSH